MSWTAVDKPTTTWTSTAKPSRGTAPDGFVTDGTTDGAFAKTGDGFFASDGTWVPVGVRHTAWTTITKPT